MPLVMPAGSLFGSAPTSFATVNADWDRIFNPPGSPTNQYSNGDRTMSDVNSAAISNLGAGAGPAPATGNPPASRSSGKWYFEILMSNTTPLNWGPFNPNQCFTGITDNTIPNDTHQMGSSGAFNSVGYRSTTGVCSAKGVAQFTGAVVGQNDTFGIASDFSALTVDYYLNNVFQGQAAIPAPGSYVPACFVGTTNATINGGTVPFVYTPPVGFLAWNN